MDTTPHSLLILIITQYQTVIGFIFGLTLGFILGWIARGIYHNRKHGKSNSVQTDALAIVTLIAVIALWGLAHINNIFFAGPDVNWVLNVIGGLAVSSIIQEKDSFVKIISAIRGGGSK